MNHLVFLLILLTAVPLTAAEIYRWTDKNGSVHLSDVPPDEQQSENIQTHYTPPVKPEPPKAPPSRAERELKELERQQREARRDAERVQTRMKIRLLQAQGHPFNSVEIYNLKKRLADYIYSEAMSTEGQEQLSLINEGIRMQEDLGSMGAIYEYKIEKRR